VADDHETKKKNKKKMASSYTIVTQLRYIEHVIKDLTNEVSQRPEIIFTDTADSAFYVESVQILVDKLMTLKDMLVRPGLLRVINALELSTDSTDSSDSN
jgi:hypothetical protein